MATSFEYMDELKVNFNLEVDNNVIGTLPPSQINYNLTTLSIPSVTQLNPIWEFIPKNYSGVIIGGTEYQSNLIKDSITTALINQGYPGLTDVFEPEWQKVNVTLSNDVVENLKQLYPNKQFFISISLEIYECDVCLIIDNIQINNKTYNIFPFYNTEGCGLPELNCIVDNKKSWTYVGDSINPITNLPDGSCHPNEVTCATPLSITNNNRLWQNLEYRYTEYDFPHSDLIINSKSAGFQITPAKTIECDVYNFWRNIDCEECPTSCVSGDSVVYSGDVIVNDSISAYTLTLSGSTPGGVGFSCETYTNSLEQSISTLKDDVYTLTADLNEAVSASYWDLIKLGGSLDTLSIVENNCQGDTLILGDRENINELQHLIIEDSAGTISLWDVYIFSGSTPYSGGDITSPFSGVSAQTINQTSGMTSECCNNLNTLLSNKGKFGLGLDKNYVWDNTLSGCTWRDINEGEGDCSHCGETSESSFTATSSGVTCEVFNKTICVNPADFLDIPPSKIKVKEVFDEMVERNLINATNRQTLSAYPTLQLFYELYLNANNCGKELSGKLTYNNLFQFMDLIGDYWLELIEQVIPSTTIMEGCENSGKVYRNTIFDNNKFIYKKYSLNFLEVESGCTVSAVTSNSIGEATVDVSVQELCVGGNCLGKELEDCNEKTQILQDQLNFYQDQLAQINQSILQLQNNINTLINQQNDTTNPQTPAAKKAEKDKENKDKKLKEEIKKTIQKNTNKS